jgi:hypothetical protein
MIMICLLVSRPVRIRVGRVNLLRRGGPRRLTRRRGVLAAIAGEMLHAGADGAGCDG